MQVELRGDIGIDGRILSLKKPEAEDWVKLTFFKQGRKKKYVDLTYRQEQTG